MTLHRIVLMIPFVVWTSCTYIRCQTINDTNTLLTDMMTDYNKNARPVLNQSEATIITFSFDIGHIKDFDEVQQKFEIVGSVGLVWEDQLMTWNPADYGVIYSLLIDSGLFWTPRIILINSADKIEKIGDSWQTIRYLFNGTAYYNPFVLLTSTCLADVTLYPWDIHKCSLYFVPQGYLPSEVKVQTSATKIGTSYYSENDAWNLCDSRVKAINDMHSSTIIIDIVFERKPLYVIINILIPVLFMAFLNLLVFLIPTESGERISYSITVLLAIAVFLTIVGDTLPKSSSPMCYFSYILMTTLISSVLIILCTIFNLRVYHSDDCEPVNGGWAKLAVFMSNCCLRESNRRVCCSNENVDTSKIHCEVTSVQEVSYDKHERIFYDSQRSDESPNAASGGIDRSGKDLPDAHDSENRYDKDKTITWKEVGGSLDTIFLATFCSILIITVVVYSITMATSERITLS